MKAFHGGDPGGINPNFLPENNRPMLLIQSFESINWGISVFSDWNIFNTLFPDPCTPLWGLKDWKYSVNW